MIAHPGLYNDDELVRRIIEDSIQMVLRCFIRTMARKRNAGMLIWPGNMTLLRLVDRIIMANGKVLFSTGILVARP